MRAMGAIPSWVSFVVLASTTAVLGIRWNDVPQRWVVHWNAHGEPNGWAEKSASAVLFPIAIGLGMWLLLELIGAAVRAGAASKPAHTPIAQATVDLLRLVSIVLSIFFGVLAISLPLGPHFDAGAIATAMLSGVLLALVIGGVRIGRAVQQVKATRSAPELEGYHGFYYANPKDGRLWVPKLLGMGWTINFAHPMAWPVMVLLVGVPITAVIAGILLSSR